ncbi:MAG: ABC transporter ATP-binding protein [Proteobacteria bacterium]|nr:ABC transporter ATP-binding protein [Pseudomonadota bacterium]
MAIDNLPKKTFPFILYFLKSYFLECLGMMIIGILWSVDLSLRPYLIKVMLDKLEMVSPHADLFTELMAPALTYIALGFGINFIYRIYDYLALRLMPSLYNDIVIKVLDYTEQHSHSYFQNHFGGSIVNKISEMARAVQDIVETIIHRFVSHSLALLIACFAMASVNLILALIFFTWVIAFLVSSYFFSKEPYILSEQLSKTHTKLIGKIMDSVTNILTVRLFARQKFEINYVKAQAREREERAQALRWSNLKRQAAMETASNILMGILICYLIYTRQQGLITIGDFALVLMVSISAIDAVWNLSRDFLEFSEQLGQCSQTLTLIAIPHEIKDTENALPLKVNRGSIEFKNVYFSFIENKFLFNNLCISIPGKQKVGLVGYSGSGKTTFVNLLIRLFDIQAGQILIDAQEVSKVTQESLHENISFIPQDPLLFHRNIAENIRYGRLYATEEEVIQAAIKANAHDFIKDLPEGYNTLVGERGIKLSGGQRQRIAIARAILKDAKILILDEATSALDSVTEHIIQESLKKLMNNKTVFVIAHRLSTLQDMDRILVFEKGKIIEDGSHQALINKKGVYAYLWERQRGGFLPAVC